MNNFEKFLNRKGAIIIRDEFDWVYFLITMKKMLLSPIKYIEKYSFKQINTWLQNIPDGELCVKYERGFTFASKEYYEKAGLEILLVDSIE